MQRGRKNLQLPIFKKITTIDSKDCTKKADSDKKIKKP
jgi:hypothetical protein